MPTYLEEKDIREILSSSYSISKFELISQESYDEEKITKKIVQFGDDSKILFCCAVHIAVIGVGNKNYGTIKINKTEHRITDLFEKYKIKYKNVQNAKLSEDDLTPRRIVRIFRYQIKDYLEKKNVVSYLWRKYCHFENRNDYKFYIFPGAEHMCNGLIANVLLETYKELDRRQNTKFTERLERIFLAKGVNVQNE